MGKTYFPNLPAARAHALEMSATGWAYAVIKETYSRGFYVDHGRSGRRMEDRGTHYRVLPVYDVAHWERPAYRTPGGCETFHKPNNAPALASADESLSPCLGGTR